MRKPPPLKKLGLSPGSLVYSGDLASSSVRATIFDFSENTLEERALSSSEETLLFAGRDTVSWLDIEGVHDVELVRRVGALFGIHPLTLEDIVNTHQRPKFEEYPDYAFMVLKMLHYDHEACEVSVEQVSLVLGHNYLISFQEAKEGDVFDPVRNRLREGRNRLRTSGADYLAYELMDLIVDHYLNVLEGIGEHIESIEDEITRDPNPALLRRINRLRRQVIFLRRSIWPLRDVFTNLERSTLPFLSKENAVYIRDVYDHTVRTMEIMESSRELLASMLELYLSNLSLRTNEVMKVLAVISTIFLPLTFVAGIYGMNFNTEASPYNMPELNWPLGYPFALGIMLLIFLGMIVFFKRKDWF